MQDDKPSTSPEVKPESQALPPTPQTSVEPASPNTTPAVPSTTDPGSQHEVEEAPKKRGGNGVFSFVATLLVAFILVQVINLFLFQSYKVFGSSMVSTLHDGDRLIISKVGKTSARVRGKDFQPKRGEIIVFIDPQRSDLQLIKRVIGLPGERVVVKDGKLTVYNKENPDGFDPDTHGDYQADLPPSSGENDVTVPEGHLFVSGDNRAGSNSLDSRNELGTVPEELVIGTLTARLWPLNDAKFF